MASDASKSDRSVIDHLRTSSSNFPPVREKIMKWRVSNPERYLVGVDEAGASGSAKIKHEIAKTANSDLENSKKAIDRIKTKKRSDEIPNNVRSKQMSSGSFLLPDLLPKSSSSARYSIQDSGRTNSRKTDGRISMITRYSTARKSEDSSTIKKQLAIQNNKPTPRHLRNSKLTQNISDKSNIPEGKKIELDDESMQIVNIALNLSESRRSASRRAIFSPSISDGIVENLSDGSLRPPIQHQPRTTRTSPSKSDDADRTFTLSSQANERGTSRLPSTILDSHMEHAHKFEFSPSTLARSKKAKIYFELMAEYRRLLHFVPPLRTCSDKIEKIKSPISAFSDHMENSKSSSQNTPGLKKQLSRDYNPLQYIRNRRLRARISRSIDGEAEGFGDLERVSAWIDSVARHVLSNEYQNTNNFSLPKFPSETSNLSGSNFSSRNNADKYQEGSTKVKRPRIDWIINPADLIADLYWLEQGANKKLIEDRYGNTIFTEEVDFKRPIIRDNRKGGLEKETFPVPNQQGSRFDLRIETDILAFESFKPKPQEITYKNIDKAHKQNHNFDKIVFVDHSSSNRGKNRLKSEIRSRSSSQSLSSDIERGRRHHRPSFKHIKNRQGAFNKKQTDELMSKKYSNVDEKFYEADFSRESFDSQTQIVSLHPEYEIQKRLDRRNQDFLRDYENKIKINQDYIMKREIARARTLLISSGIKAKEIKRRAEIKNDLTADEDSSYVEVAALTQRPLALVSTIHKHKLAVQIISEDINRSLYVWNSTSEMLIRKTMESLKHRISTLKTEITENLTPMARSAADEADSLSRDLVIDHRLAVTQIADQITQLKRRRKARLRWLGRGWWVVLEWVLIGIMWLVWLIVVIIRIVLGTGKIVIGGIRWFFWL
ncbi:hypothetical protein OnM2_010002 [Erysiphe neolycopersici]|uniref:Uncharacterized protein n=1 Tax=Erysiphe neolycopersici TaxID=212602 RepID=A0A420I6J8_9PEZI|nr:hypothetical protein OnM2_010002 [Erysiphe neolycopersici]